MILNRIGIFQVFFILTVILSNINILRSQADFTRYNSLLKQFVDSNGKVNYSKLKLKEEVLITISKEFSSTPILKSWSINDQLAYYINLYNLETILLLTRNYPLKSILDLDEGKTWDVKRIKQGDKLISLNEIENEIIRKKFKDPRIHFALNCGAESCPPLMNRAFEGKTLDKQLDTRTKLFINRKENVLNENRILKISKIFDWYKEDFGNVIDYLNKYSDIKITDRRIEFMKYSWNLNKE